MSLTDWPIASSDDAIGPAFDAVKAICQRHSKRLYFGSFFLPKPKRRALYAINAFCRMMFDAINQYDTDIEGAAGMRYHPIVSTSSTGCCSGGGLEQRLRLFRSRLDEIYENRLELPGVAARSEPQHALYAFWQTVRHFEVPKQHFIDLAEGYRMDLTTTRYATWHSLENYCYHVAGVVGLIMSSILGVQHSDAGHQLVKLGNAIQLTNSLCNVKKDYDCGRIYLPLEDMVKFKYSENCLSAHLVNDSFRELMKFEITRTRMLYAEGSAGLRWLADDGSRFIASVYAAVNMGILDAIERQNFDVFSTRVHLTWSQKARQLPIAWKWAKQKG